MNSHDITGFMTWFVNQCVRIFSYTYSTLDSITFAGTSLLKVMVALVVLGTLLPIIMTLPSNAVDSYSAKLSRDDKLSKKHDKNVAYAKKKIGEINK